MSGDRIDCEQALRQVFDYIDKELDAHEHAAMEDHLETCRACFSRVEFERRLKSRIADLREEEPSPDIEQRIKSMIRSF